MAMLPFIGYNAGDYMQHWINLGKKHDMPEVFLVNWFRRDENNKFVWPGFGENSRVLKWVIERLEGTADATETPIGFVPVEGAIDTTGLDITPEQLKVALNYSDDEWKKELPLIEEWFAKFGDDLPTELTDELTKLKARLNN
ncbi:molecular chaperone DnaJ [Platysternon megacephalum]|uniref:Molecular chaperone DnaJ n=1 Tax=Platysternon megacephalum TaxID=55544 RepID=A0A4D9DDQ2_9SAUR|nr:molecular chaperone DnaJ [Platysternon megacephalum]